MTSLIGARTLRGRSNPSGVTGAVVNWIGDSISPAALFYSGYGGGGIGGTTISLRERDFMAWAHLLSNGQIKFGKMAGVGGQNASQMWPRVDTDALTYGGNFCGITSGYNDAALIGADAPTYAANIRKICGAIVSRGQIPLLTTCTPSLSSPRQLMDRYRRFIIAYAADTGFPLADPYSKLVDPASLGYLSAYDSGDHIHPNAAGLRLYGQSIVDALTPYLPPWNVPGVLNNLASTSANLLDNATFAVDTNADGVPDGWTKAGSGTVGLTTGDPAIVGNALRLSDAASSGLTTVSSTVTVAAGGRRLLFTGLIKCPGAGGNFALTTNGTHPVSLTALTGFFANTGWVEPFSTWQRFYLEGRCSPNTTSITLTLSSTTVGGPGLDCSVAQLGIYDLSACGI